MPYLVMFLLCIVFSHISDILMNRKIVKVGTGRKLYNSIGHWISAASLIGLGYVSKDQSTLCVVILTISVGLNSAAYVCFLINHIDLSPNFAGILIGLTNCVSNIMLLLAPIFVGFIVTDAVRCCCCSSVCNHKCSNRLILRCGELLSLFRLDFSSVILFL